MVKVTLKEESKVIEHECECAFSCMIRPAEAPEGSKAMACLLGETSLEEGDCEMCFIRIRPHEPRG